MMVKSEVKKSRKIFTQIHPMSHLQRCEISILTHNIDCKNQVLYSFEKPGIIVKSEVKKLRKIFTQIYPMSHLQQCGYVD